MQHCTSFQCTNEAFTGAVGECRCIYYKVCLRDLKKRGMLAEDTRPGDG